MVKHHPNRIVTIDPDAPKVDLTDVATDWLRRVITESSDHCHRISVLAQELNALPEKDRKSIAETFKDRPMTLFSMLAIPPEVVMATGKQDLAIAAMIQEGENLTKALPHGILEVAGEEDALSIVLITFKAALESFYAKLGVSTFLHLIESLCVLVRKAEESRIQFMTSMFKKAIENSMPEEVKKIIEKGGIRN